jgi:ABC-type Fe3+-hydroxamate transport system substrate-binding protein
LKKAVIFVALVSAVFFSNCKNNTEAAPEEQMEQTVTDSTVTVTDSIKTDEVTPEVATKDTLTTPKVK